LSNPSPTPHRGEIWLVNFEPTLGAEIRKTRPAIVVSSDAVGRLPIKLVAPLTDWKVRYAPNVWHVRIDPDPQNGLSKPSAIDVLQLRGLDTQRFVQILGQGTKALAPTTPAEPRLPHCWGFEDSAPATLSQRAAPVM
jgi:mRNA interferase MazF